MDEAIVDTYQDRLERENSKLIVHLATVEKQLAAAERDADTLLGMIRHQRDVLRECLPYLNESSADDIRAAVKALTADAALERPCTCHPDDNPPVPCPRKYALTECRQAALERTP